MRQNPLTILAPIIPAERGALQTLLREVGQDVMGNPYIRFSEIESTHFARFVMIGGGSPQDRDTQTRLLFSTNHDGETDAYLDLLISKAGSGLQSIFSKCQGFPSLPADDPKFANKCKAYLLSHSLPANTFYQGYPGYTVQQVKSCLQLPQQLRNYLNRDEIQPLMDIMAGIPYPPQNLLEKLEEWFTRLALKRKILHVILQFVEKVFGYKTSTDPAGEQSIEVNTRPEVTDWLYTVQNEMTVITAIDPAKLESLKRFLAIVNFVAQHNPTPGSLNGLTTIHFARWAILDDGATLFFESNYDGNWEQYIGDFVDKASGGMDGIWGNCIGFPPRGSKDLQAFKKIIIDHQVRAEVFYSAYPQHSVRNILNDLELSRQLSNFVGKKEIKTWLGRL